MDMNEETKNKEGGAVCKFFWMSHTRTKERCLLILTSSAVFSTSETSEIVP